MCAHFSILGSIEAEAVSAEDDGLAAKEEDAVGAAKAVETVLATIRAERTLVRMVFRYEI